MRNCEVCQEEIKSKNVRSKYCGRECDPKRETNCLTCNTELKDQNKFKFCSRSCSAKFNNVAFPKRKLEGVCSRCPETCAKGRKYCRKCLSNHNIYTSTERPPELRNRGYNTLIVAEWIMGLHDGRAGKKYKSSLNKAIRSYLLHINNFTCVKCKFNKTHPTDGATILEVNHINGDGTDHRYENLEVICPNCHSLTESYRGRNSGKSSREYHYLRIDTIK